MTKTEIKQLAKSEMFYCIQFYEIDDLTLESLTDHEKILFYAEFEKLATRIKKIL